MKTISKFLLAGAVAVVAIAVSAAPSEAAKKKVAKGAKFPVGACTPGTACTGAPNPLQDGRGVVYMCGGDAKWVANLSPGCSGPGCPPPCI